jgi:PTS system mannose-specific IIC component
MVVAVGYAMVINMMATPDLWPFFYMGFALAAVSDLNLVAMGIIGVCLALIYLQLSPAFNAPEGNTAALGSGGADPLDDILADYE